MKKIFLIVLLLSLSTFSFSYDSKGTRIKHYSVYHNGTVLDTKLNLLWMRCAIGQIWTGSSCSGKIKEMSWQQAMNYRTTFAGHSDWRLPTKKELASLIYCSNEQFSYFSMGKDFNEKDEGCKGEGYINPKDHDAPTIMKAVFPNSTWTYWSSTYDNNGKNAWTIGFNYGGARLSLVGNNHKYSVRLIHTR